MRVAIFASSDSITDEMLPRLEELVESRHALVKTHIFPNRPMAWNMLKSFGGDAVAFGLKMKGGLKPTAQNPNFMVDWVDENEVDVIINLTGYIYYGDILTAPTYGVIGKHASVLPKYRGMLPVFWAMLHEEPMGVTVFKLNEKIDKGEILTQRTLWPEETLYESYKKVYQATPELILEALEVLPHIEKYWGMPTKDDYSQFKKMGYSL